MGFKFGYGLGLSNRCITTQASSWDGTIATSYGGGTGTVTNPYLITKASELAYLAQVTNAGTTYAGKYFRQEINLDLKSLPWTPIGLENVTVYFGGNYDSNGYVITNLYIDSSSTFRGLFGGTRAATISVAVLSGYVKGSTNTGGLVGYAYSTTLINCINGCDVWGSAAGTQFIGGIAGRIVNSSNISNCYNIGSVNGTGFNVGGITGLLSTNSTCTNCYNAAFIAATATGRGSILGGITTSTCTGCYYDNQLSSVGGINNIDVAGQAEGKTTLQMKTESTFVGWNFADYWLMDVDSYPKLIKYL